MCIFIYIYKYGSWSSQSQFFTRNSWTLENSMYVHKYSAFIHICIYIYMIYICLVVSTGCWAPPSPGPHIPCTLYSCISALDITIYPLNIIS